MLKKIDHKDYERLFKWLQKDPARNYFILLGLKKILQSLKASGLTKMNMVSLLVFLKEGQVTFKLPYQRALSPSPLRTGWKPMILTP